jgi:hypothetical protein
MKGLVAIVTMLLMGVLVLGGVATADPVKPADPYAGKKAGNTGFANFVGDNLPTADVSGWVRYSKNGKSLLTTWVVDGLQPGAWYQLKLHSKGGDPRVGNACDAPNTGPIWMCGSWDSESFLVMDIVQANAEGHIGAAVKETRLPSGDYSKMQFMVTLNALPWSSAWTWENPGTTISSFTIK